MEEKNLWIELREKVAGLGAGFYTTESGIEIDLLKRLFTEEEAKTYVSLYDKAEPLDLISNRMNRPREEVMKILDEMARKGTVSRVPMNPPCYFPSPFVPGFCEWTGMILAHIEKDKETAEIMEQYWKEGEERLHGSILRPIPVMKSVSGDATISSYDDIRRIMKSADRLAVSPCACDLHHKDMGRDISDRPLERCFQIGAGAAAFAIEHGGRETTYEEAMAILDKCDESDLVVSVAPFESPVYVCTCGKNCYEIKQKKMRGNAGLEAGSNYYAVVDRALCTGCSICVDRCVMDALTINNEGLPELNLNRCVGCGLCVTKCPTEAIKIRLKDKSQQCTPTDKHWSSKSESDIIAELMPYMDEIKPL